MLRYQQLILAALEQEHPHKISLRDLARLSGVPVSSLHNYAYLGSIPHIQNLERLSSHFGEPIATLLSDDDDLTAAILTEVRKLDRNTKKQILQTIYSYGRQQTQNH